MFIIETPNLMEYKNHTSGMSLANFIIVWLTCLIISSTIKQGYFIVDRPTLRQLRGCCQKIIILSKKYNQVLLKISNLGD